MLKSVVVLLTVGVINVPGGIRAVKFEAVPVLGHDVLHIRYRDLVERWEGGEGGKELVRDARREY